MSEQRLLAGLRNNGFCVLPGLIPLKRCEEIRESLIATAERERNNFNSPTDVSFVPSVINHDQSFAEYLGDERLMRIVSAMLGEHVRISFTSVIINEPGNARGKWHADWPFNQHNAGRVLAPYPDAVMHLTTLWMLTPFGEENSGTLVVPGSHRFSTNPTSAECEFEEEAPYPTEMHATGDAGSVLIFDSRLWHSTAPNRSSSPRVALAVRYAPWWLNLEVLRPESDERQRMVNEPGLTDNIVPSIQHDVFERLPGSAKPLYRHWISD